jgi:hypothetical protein
MYSFSLYYSKLYKKTTICRAQSDHTERSDLAKRFFIAGWERERAKGRGGGGGQGVKYPTLGRGMF